MKKLHVILTSLVWLVLLPLTVNANPAQTKSSKGLRAPSFEFMSVTGTEKIGPQHFKGNYLLLDFWASWCPPCNAAIPKLKEIYSTYAPKGFEILGVSIDGDEQAWRKNINQKGVVWSNVLAPNRGQEISTIYGFSAIPYFVLIDKEGNIIQQGFTIDELPAIMKTLL